MSNDPLADARSCLGVGPDDGPLKIKQAYQKAKAIYGEDSLATYALLENEERQERLEQIEAAYQLIMENLSLQPPASRKPAEPAAVPLFPADPKEVPGRFLQQCRMQAGMSLQDISKHTNIGARQFELIEAERHELLPATVYLRSFILQYAQIVGVPDPEEITRLYLDKIKQLKQQS